MNTRNAVNNDVVNKDPERGFILKRFDNVNDWKNDENDSEKKGNERKNSNLVKNL